MSQNRPGVSAYSRQQWQAIHPIFRNIYMDQGCSLEKTMMVLELICNFKATKDAFRNQIKWNWRDCATNNLVANVNRTRPKRIKAMFPDLPDYIAGLAVGAVPRSLSFQRYESHVRVLLSLDKYTKGFFDSLPPQDNDAEEDANAQKKEKEQKPAIGGRWCRALSLCQEISILPQKKKDFIVFSNLVKDHGSKKAAKEEGIEKMKNIVTSILNDKVFTKLEVNEKESTPKDLPALWSICRVLRGLSSQLGHSEDSEALLMRLFLGELRESFAQITQGSNTDMGRALEHVRDIPSEDLKDIARISCLCSARALSSRLEPHDPVVLEAWADYYQHYDRSKLRKDVFLNHYKRAYAETKAKHQTTKKKPDAERALLVLINYSYVAHYICHDKALAYRLSSELWDLTGAPLSKEKPPKTWSVKVHGMAQAAKIQALLCYVKHEDKLKSHEDFRKNIHKYNLVNKRTRHRYHMEILQERQKCHELSYLPPYDPEAQVAFGLQEVIQKLVFSRNLGFKLLATELHDLFATLLDTETQTMENLRVALTKLHASNDQDCQLLAAGLYDQLASIASACSKDVNSVLRSIESLFKKAEDSPLTEMEESNLKRYLAIKRQERRLQGKKCRLEAKGLRQLVVAFDNYVDI